MIFECWFQVIYLSINELQGLLLTQTCGEILESYYSLPRQSVFLVCHKNLLRGTIERLAER